MNDKEEAEVRENNEYYREHQISNRGSTKIIV